MILDLVKKAKDVFINRSNTGVAADNVEDAIKVLNSDLGSLIDKVYPIGSIYMSVNANNPSTLFGGTWVEWGSGKVPVGVNVSDSNFNTVEKTGGSATNKLSTANLPSHHHTVGAHSHGLNNHTHTYAAPANHTHTLSETGYAMISTWSDRVVSRQQSQSFEATYGTFGNGTGYHETLAANNAVKLGGTTGTGGASTPSITGQASGNTANSAAFNSGKTGSGTAVNNLQPYVTCYMWKRTA